MKIKEYLMSQSMAALGLLCNAYFNRTLMTRIGAVLFLDWFNLRSSFKSALSACNFLERG
jgi:hypothetical protein